MQCCPSCGRSRRKTEPLSTAPVELKQRVIASVTRNGECKLKDIVFSCYASVAVVYWDDRTQNWVKMFCINSDNKGGLYAVCSYAFVMISTPNEVYKAGYRSERADAFNAEVNKRINAITDHLCSQVCIKASARRTQFSCVESDHKDAVLYVDEWDTFYRCETISILTGTAYVSTDGLLFDRHPAVHHCPEVK